MSNSIPVVRRAIPDRLPLTVGMGFSNFPNFIPEFKRKVADTNRTIGNFSQAWTPIIIEAMEKAINKPGSKLSSLDQKISTKGQKRAN